MPTEQTAPATADMRYVRVLSSQVDAVGYDPRTNELRVRFHNSPEGVVYVYASVSHEHVTGLVFAESPGKYLNAFIKTVYPFVKLEGQKVVCR